MMEYKSFDAAKELFTVSAIMVGCLFAAAILAVCWAVERVA